MVTKKNNIYKFNIKNVGYELFFAEDGFIEFYEVKDPGKTGFIFSDMKKFTSFINSITDILEKEMEENKSED